MHSRYEMNKNREKSLENAGKVVSSMVKNDSKTVFKGNSLIMRGDQYIQTLIDTMHEKKIQKKWNSATPSNKWNYPATDLSFSMRPKPSYKIKLKKLNSKPSDFPIAKEKNKIKRLPPPNFMIAMRNLHKVYENTDPRIDDSTRRSRNISSLF